MKRLLSLVLAIVMAISLFCIPSFAANNKKYYPYKTYTCLGDSIAAGCGLTRSGEETYFPADPNEVGNVLNEDYMYLGYGYDTIPQAYHSLVANALGADLLQCARSAMRAVELRYLLDGVYNDYDESMYVGNHYFCVGDTFEPEDLKSLNADYIGSIKKADLITINLGSNDVFSFAMNMVLKEMEETSTDQNVLNICRQMDVTGNATGIFVELAKYFETIGKLGDIMRVLTTTLVKAYDQFKVNWDAVIKNIYKLNPDVTIVAVGVYNPLASVSLTGSGLNVVQAATEPTKVKLNSFIKSYESKYDNYYFADVTGTNTYPMSLTDELFMTYFGIKAHPTIAGHQFMAKQILSVLPDYFPFVDVAKTDWCYDSIKYCYDNDLMIGTTSTTFDPNSTMTRATVATVLYRINGSPDVSGLKNPFPDVTPGHYYTNAAIWAYNKGIVLGCSDGKFHPDTYASRQQFATMLYRYACCYGHVDKNAYQPPLVGYVDAKEVAPYAETAMRWAVAKGIVKGKTLARLDPTGDATRAQCATMIARFDQFVVNS